MLHENNVCRRILYAENGIGYGGAIICLRYLITNLDRSRFEPYLVTGRTGPEYLPIATEVQWRCIPDRLLDLAPLRRRLASQPASVTGNFLRRCIVQLIARIDDVVNFAPHFMRFLAHALMVSPALIHTNNEPSCNRAAILVGRLLRIPVVSHVRDPLDGQYHSPWLYGLPAHYLPVSAWVLRRLAELGVPPEKCTLTYDGIPLERLDIDADGAEFRSESEIPAGAFAVGLVGLLIPWKGQNLFLDAIAQLRDEIPNLRALIIGGTPTECAAYESALRERVAREGLSDIVSFTGHVTKMDRVYRGLDAVVSASTTPEPLGTVVIEAMALGRPLVVPNHGGGAEMVDDKINALVFEAGDAVSLADAIRSFHHDPALGTRLGGAARAKAIETFDVARHVREVEAVYEALLMQPAEARQ